MERARFYGCVCRGQLIRKADYRARTSLEVCQFNAMAKADSYYSKFELMAMSDFDDFWMKWWNDTLVPKGYPEITPEDFHAVRHQQNIRYMLANFLKN